MVKFLMNLVITFILLVMNTIEPIFTTFVQPQAPNFQYFERPQYRYPYYDENGRGRLLYGYGGSQLYHYKTYSTLEGIY